MKKNKLLLYAFGWALTFPATLFAQGNFTLQQQVLDNPENTPRPVFPVPTERQLKWNETEFYAFTIMV